MDDLFYREQQIYDDAAQRSIEIKNGDQCGTDEYVSLVNEYGRLLKQLRRVTKVSDRTTIDLNSTKLDLLNKVHFDALTGIYNRRFMDDKIWRIVKSASQSGTTLSVCMIDIDYFKKYNDTYGHSAGDVCLKAVADALSKSIGRSEDFIARYGGEEFIAVLPNTDEKGALFVAGLMLKNVKSKSIPHIKSDAADYVTISIGVTSSVVKPTHSAGDFIRRADEALYISKSDGRNRYTFLGFED